MIFRKAISIGLLLALSSFSQSITGKVINVKDGDTIVLLDGDNKQHTIRLAEIDAPEKAQDFGQVSKQNLSTLIFGKNVTVKVTTTDKYGRSIGNVYLNNLWINLKQVEDGLAWHYKAYSKSDQIANAEIAAKSKKLGLWVNPNAVAPWIWRKSKK